MEDRKDVFIKIQTFFDNLVKEPSKKVNNKLRYEALKIIGEKNSLIMSMLIKWEFF